MNQCTLLIARADKQKGIYLVFLIELIVNKSSRMAIGNPNICLLNSALTLDQHLV